MRVPPRAGSVEREDYERPLPKSKADTLMAELDQLELMAGRIMDRFFGGGTGK